MSTNAVSFLLLNAFRDGAEIDTLAKALDKLREQLSLTDRDCGFVGDSVDVINHAVSTVHDVLRSIPNNSIDLLVTTKLYYYSQHNLGNLT